MKAIIEKQPTAPDRSAFITLGGMEYELILTTRATKVIAKRYGGLETLGDRLMNTENFEQAIDEIVWLITLLLLNELEQIKAVLKDDDNEDADILIGKISSAKKSIKQNQEGKAIEIIKAIGKKIMDIAVKIGCPLIVKIITEKIS